MSTALQAPIVQFARTTDRKAQNITLDVSIDELKPLYYRNKTYMLPAAVVLAPVPTRTAHLIGNVQLFSIKQNRARVLSSLKSAISSAIDAASLLKIAALAHSEDCHDLVEVALQKALKVSQKDATMQQQVRRFGEQLVGMAA